MYTVIEIKNFHRNYKNVLIVYRNRKHKICLRNDAEKVNLANAIPFISFVFRIICVSPFHQNCTLLLVDFSLTIVTSLDSSRWLQYVNAVKKNTTCHLQHRIVLTFVIYFEWNCDNRNCTAAVVKSTKYGPVFLGLFSFGPIRFITCCTSWKAFA